MANDGFLGGSFHGLAWPYDALQVQRALWEHDVASERLDSALSSLVSSSSPSSLAAAAAAAAMANGGAREVALMDELASRLSCGLGGGGGGGVPSPPSSRYASCYSTPVGSPGKPAAATPALPLLAADALVGERAARLTGRRKLSRVASSQSLLAEPATPAAVPAGVHLPASDGSSSDGPSRKRKAPGGKARGKKCTAMGAAIGKSPEPETRAKKCKQSTDSAAGDDAAKPAPGGGNGKAKKDVDDEEFKDYIHVRARRGQATDSHSLAERVRREKISERMKLLQDIVPGCNKVTGKAVMLDEIINYVQSLQRQVEFLSMKLSTVNPQLELDVDNFLPEDQSSQQCLPAPLSLPAPPPPSSYSPDGSGSVFCYPSSQPTAVQSVVTSVKGFEMQHSFAHHGIPVSSPLEGFHSANSQVGSLWEDDLQSVVQMGFRGNP